MSPPSCGEFETLTTEKWLSLCTTIEQAKEAHSAAPSSSEFEMLAMEKWLSLCTTPEQVMEAYKTSPCECSELQELAIQKLSGMPDEE